MRSPGAPVKTQAERVARLEFSWHFLILQAHNESPGKLILIDSLFRDTEVPNRDKLLLQILLLRGNAHIIPASFLSSVYGAHLPHGLYPISIASSRVPEKGALFFSFISSTDGHDNS